MYKERDYIFKSQYSAGYIYYDLKFNIIRKRNQKDLIREDYYNYFFSYIRENYNSRD